MRVTQEQFEKMLMKEFGGKYTVAYWETVPSDDGKDEVIHVGLAKADLTLAEAIDLPREINGVKMVYEYSGEMKLLTTQYHDPLIGGVSIGAVDITAGTYGGVVWDKETDEPFFLTNEHVVSDTTNNHPAHPPLEHPILQPGAIDGGIEIVGWLERVGGMKAAALRGESHDIDAALIKPNRAFRDSEYFQLGHVEAFKHVPVKVDDNIVKVGRTTGVTFAEVGAVGVSANIGGISWASPITMTNLIMTKRSFIQEGDSGSRVWETKRMQPVGLVFAGSWATSMIIPAETICKKFGVIFGKKEPAVANSEGGENMDEEKSIWQMKELWMPIIVGVAGALAFIFQETLGVAISPEMIISVILAVAGLLFGVGWATVRIAQVKIKQLQK